MVNALDWDIQMEATSASDNESGRLPVLDYQVWTEKFQDGDVSRTRFLWKFYEKSMVSKFVIREEGALPQRMKITVFSQEVIRRERNTSRKVDIKVRI